MRKILLLLSFVVAACGGNGDTPRMVSQPVLHVPEISNLRISPDSATFMEGNGSVLVTAEVTFSDAGRDIAAIWVQMPDGTRAWFDEPIAAASGTFTRDFAMPTNQIGAFLVEIWLVDEAGNRSAHHVVDFIVIEKTWMSRMSGLPHTLFDVVWNGNVFIAVGNGGTIFTSTDGIDWVAVDSGTNADLRAVAADGPHVVAVGLQVILQSNDDGASWAVRDSPIEALLEAVAINASQIIVGGHRWGWGTPITRISDDRGDTWQTVDSWPDENLLINDLIYRDGMYLATTTSPLGLRSGTWVTISLDGKLWNEIEVSDEGASLRTVIHDGSQFVVAGSPGAVFTSPDGVNWTQLQTPVQDVTYTGVAWSGEKLVLAGRSMCGDAWICESPLDVPAALASTDGGTTWETFDIDSDYVSWGLAWGNGQFVSVGNKPRFSDDGAIYTAD